MKNQAVELLPIDSVTPYQRNTRVHSPANIQKIAASIKEFGWTVPILVDEAGAILAGHGRLLAAHALSMPEVPCLTIPGLSSAQKRAYRLADNRLTLDSDWDWEALKLELGELIDFDLALTGFDPQELDDILGRNAPQEGEDDAPALQEVAVSRLGEIWALGPHRLLCGDATSPVAVAWLLEGATPVIMVTDPPYGVQYDATWRSDLLKKKVTMRSKAAVLNDDRADWREAWALFHGPIAYVWHSGIWGPRVAESLLVTGLEIRAQIIWVKDRVQIGRGHYHWQHEGCWYAVRHGCTAHWEGDRKESTVWEFKNLNFASDETEDTTEAHSTQKPAECMRRPIVNHTSSGQAVYDPFMGSGTTIIAAETTARVCYGCEINPLYVDMAIRRWQTFTGKTATRLEDGKAFE